ncbi:MAG: DUF58 domain-containing protein [Chitinophagaceae bacterium]|nr:MAG: DUF58 domain-containing protein [Chitinophagaceae bacterium]
MTEKFVKLQDLHQFDNLELLAKQVVEGFIIGLHKSPYHGFSVEFAEHRLYNPGDPIKNIDWKVFARTNRYYVKKYEEETNLRCQLIIDASSSMFYPENSPVNKIKFSILSAASIMHMLKKQRDAFGLSIFSDKIETNYAPKSTNVHHKLLLSNLTNLAEQSPRGKKTKAAENIHILAESIHRRSLVILFSDMMENTAEQEEIFSALQHLKYNKHEVIVFHVVDKAAEIDFEFENRPYVFVDMESGEKVKLRSNEVKKFYTEQAEKFKRSLMLKCGQFNIDFIEADINKDFKQILLPFLLKRAKMQ